MCVSCNWWRDETSVVFLCVCCVVLDGTNNIMKGIFGFSCLANLNLHVFLLVLVEDFIDIF